MAIAWTPYTFYFNDQLSHCGVNVFSLIKGTKCGKLWVLQTPGEKRAATKRSLRVCLFLLLNLSLPG